MKKGNLKLSPSELFHALVAFNIKHAEKRKFGFPKFYGNNMLLSAALKKRKQSSSGTQFYKDKCRILAEGRKSHKLH